MNALSDRDRRLVIRALRDAAWAKRTKVAGWASSADSVMRLNEAAALEAIATDLECGVPAS